MKEIASYQMKLFEKISTTEITHLHNYASSSEYDIYLYQNGHIADAENFPKVVSFFLLADIKDPLVVIIDGENPDQAFHHIKHLLNQRLEKTIIRKIHRDKDGVSILV